MGSFNLWPWCIVYVHNILVIVHRTLLDPRWLCFVVCWQGVPRLTFVRGPFVRYFAFYNPKIVAYLLQLSFVSLSPSLAMSSQDLSTDFDSKASFVKSSFDLSFDYMDYMDGSNTNREGHDPTKSEPTLPLSAPGRWPCHIAPPRHNHQHSTPPAQYTTTRQQSPHHWGRCSPSQCPSRCE